MENLFLDVKIYAKNLKNKYDLKQSDELIEKIINYFVDEWNERTRNLIGKSLKIGRFDTFDEYYINISDLIEYKGKHRGPNSGLQRILYGDEVLDKRMKKYGENISEKKLKNSKVGSVESIRKKI